MTKQHQADFDSWKQDQSQALPKSLKNILIERLVEEFNNDNLIDLMCEKYKKEVVRKIQPERGYNYIAFCHPDDIPSSYHNWHYTRFHRLPERVQVEYLLFFLSRTPDGQAIMPFLDVELDLMSIYIGFQDKVKANLFLANSSFIPLTLDHLLYRGFTEALRTGKSFEKALEIITKTYLLHL